MRERKRDNFPSEPCKNVALKSDDFRFKNKNLRYNGQLTGNKTLQSYRKYVYIFGLKMFLLSVFIKHMSKGYIKTLHGFILYA